MSIGLIDLPRDVLFLIYKQLRVDHFDFFYSISEYCIFLSCKTLMNTMIGFYKNIHIFKRYYWINRRDIYLLKVLELGN